VPNTFLDLKMTRYGREWWYRESAYASPNDSGFPNLVGTQGNFNALNIYSLWRDGPFASSTTSAIPGENPIDLATNWGYRFANAIVLMEK
jgi:hypothetical protein